MMIYREITLRISAEIPDGLDEEEQREFINEFDENLNNDMDHMERIIEGNEEIDIDFEWQRTMEA